MLPLFYSLRWFSDFFTHTNRKPLSHTVRKPRLTRPSSSVNKHKAKRCPPVPSGGTPIYLTGEGAQNKGLSQALRQPINNRLPHPIRKGGPGVSPRSRGRGAQRSPGILCENPSEMGSSSARAPPCGRQSPDLSIAL